MLMMYCLYLIWRRRNLLFDKEYISIDFDEKKRRKENIGCGLVDL